MIFGWRVRKVRGDDELASHIYVHEAPRAKVSIYIAKFIISPQSNSRFAFHNQVLLPTVAIMCNITNYCPAWSDESIFSKGIWEKSVVALRVLHSLSTRSKAKLVVETMININAIYFEAHGHLKIKIRWHAPGSLRATKRFAQNLPGSTWDQQMYFPCLDDDVMASVCPISQSRGNWFGEYPTNISRCLQRSRALFWGKSWL